MATCVLIPKKIIVNGEGVTSQECSYLAVHPKLRGKKMAAIMIGEAFRLSRLSGSQVQYYTTGQSQPTPFATSHYMNRFLDPKKLVDVHYCLKPPNMNMDQFVKLYRLPKPDMINIEGSIRSMQKKDVTTVLKLL